MVKKHLNIFFSGTKKASRLNLIPEHWGLKVILIYLNDDPRLSFDLFYDRVKFACLCICMRKILKIQLLFFSQNVLNTYG